MSKASAKLPAVQTPTHGGVTLRRHVLDLEAAKLTWINRRVGQRLSRWLRGAPELVQGFTHEWEDGHPVTTPMLEKDGSPVMVPLLPDEPFRESWKIYASTTLGLLREQRERAKLGAKTGAVVLSDEEMQAALEEMLEVELKAMPEEKLQRILAARVKVEP